MTALGEAPAKVISTSQRRHTRRPPAPYILVGASILVALVLLLPLAFLIDQARQVGWSELAPVLFRRLTLTLIWNTARLAVAVTVLCGIIGTLSAWCVERTHLPGRRLWAVLLVVPVAMPDFVTAFGWVSLTQRVQGFGGAVLVMTLALYPLVYLPVAASFRNADPVQEEVARSLGLGRLRTFWRVSLGQARIAIVGGCLLVTLMLLAEYGAFEILGYQTFTTEIFTEFLTGFDQAAACALSIVLVIGSLFVLTGDVFLRGGRMGRGGISRTGPLARRVARRHDLGRARIPVIIALAVLVAGALGVPLGEIVRLMIAGGQSTLPSASIAAAAGWTVLYSGTAAAISTAMALPVALLTMRHPTPARLMLERSTYIVLAIPGLVIALALTFFSERDLGGFAYQSSYLLVAAYAIMFFPLALVGVRASVAQSPLSLEEVARSLGQRKAAVLRRVVVPLVGPGLAAAFSLVFLSAVTELTATLILRPPGVETLATQFWVFQTNLSYGQAAPYAAIIVGIAAVPSYVLTRWFDRLPRLAEATR